jgi:hypothetical protein
VANDHLAAGDEGEHALPVCADRLWAGAWVSRRGPLPTAPVELLIEWPADTEAPTTYWFADLRGEHLGLRRYGRLAKGRWRIEQDYRELKDELGLDHFEGRSWPGWRHHATLASMAYAFLVLEGRRRQGRRASPSPRSAGNSKPS